MADGTRGEATDEAHEEAGTDRAHAASARDGQPTSSPVTRRWRGLDRGWQALALGFAVVAVSAAVF